MSTGVDAGQSGTGLLRPVRFQVCVVEQRGDGGHCFALLPDLGCEEIGGDREQALAAVGWRAQCRLAGCSDGRSLCPPSRLTLASIELALPWPERQPRPAGSSNVLVLPVAGRRRRGHRRVLDQR
jgi:hypothetical protein